MFLLSVLLNAQAPAGYYDRADGTKGAALKTALCNIIYSHKTLSYDALWDAFRTTDRRADGKVWDMYSSTTNYTFGTDQAGNNTGREGGNYNREHSFPKSWFDDARPMYTDLFHLYPTDTYVNGMRSNLPFGETSRPTYSSNGGFSKVGPSSVSGYSGKVFEPNDEYKGDFARTYFYMATCYENQIASWSCDMLAGNKYPAYANWALQMLLRWAEEDPVSEKETDRNNAVYKLQGNRNPYIDFPGLEQYVWGDKKDVAFDPDNYDGGGDPEPPTPDVAAPTFSPAGGTMTAGTTVTISTTTKGADICYAIDGGSEQQASSPVRLTINRSTTITARALLDGVYSPTVSATYVVGTAPQPSDGTYVLINSVDDLTPGAGYLVVCLSSETALSAQDDDVRSPVDVSISGSTIETETGADGLPYELTLGGSEGSYTLYDAAGECYLALNSNSNKLHTSTQATEASAQWDITFEGDNAVISNCQYDDRSICYNSSSPRFACYKTSSRQKAVALFKAHSQTTGIAGVVTDGDGLTDVYTIDGRLVRRGVRAEGALNGLPAGLYVVGGVKVLVR